MLLDLNYLNFINPPTPSLAGVVETILFWTSHFVLYCYFIFVSLLFLLACLDVVFAREVIDVLVAVLVALSVVEFWAMGIMHMIVVSIPLELRFYTVSIDLGSSFRCFGLWF